MKLKPSTIRFRVIRALIALFALFFLASCATLITGARQNLRIKSDPPGANIFINGQNTFTQTPGKVSIKRRQKKSSHNSLNELNITLKKEGYQDAYSSVHSSFNGLAAVSILFGGWPFIVDWASGAHLNYPKNHFLALERAEEIISPPLKPYITHYNSDSDIDTDIPETWNKKYNKFALIIGNENYADYQAGLGHEANVVFAKNDAYSFKSYATKVLGVPNDQVLFLTNATLTQMQRALIKLNKLAKSSGEKAELIFYYAGHGIPHEKTKEPYLLPIDVSGNELSLAIKLSDVYSMLTEHEIKRATCFLDCCFSGGAREQGLIASRGITVTPKNNQLNDNLIVFTASSGKQSALPYREQQHGIFTYFLLRKIKETKGDLKYGELAQYLSDRVSISSIVINNKEQDPQVIVSPSITDDWRSWDLK